MSILITYDLISHYLKLSCFSSCYLPLLSIVLFSVILTRRISIHLISYSIFLQVTSFCLFFAIIMASFAYHVRTHFYRTTHRNILFLMWQSHTLILTFSKAVNIGKSSTSYYVKKSVKRQRKYCTRHIAANWIAVLRVLHKERIKFR